MRRGYSILALLIGLMLLSSCASTKPLCLDPDAKLRGDFKYFAIATCYTTFEDVQKREEISVASALAEFVLALITFDLSSGYEYRKHIKENQENYDCSMLMQPEHYLTLLDGNRFVRAIKNDKFSLGFQYGRFKIENNRIIGTVDSTQLVCGVLEDPLEPFLLYAKLDGEKVLLYPEPFEEMAPYTANRKAVYSTALSEEIREAFSNRSEDSTCISLEKEERNRNILAIAIMSPLVISSLLGLVAAAGITYSTIANWPF